ncbi:MAG: CHAT domain-containing protein, partial [Elainellaceae cyanobacterium]
NTLAFFNQDFSRLKIEPEMEKHTVIHFATHAEFVPGFPHESFILFGNGDRVSLGEILDWSLPEVDLVVLSACRTAVSGGLGSGEEILGFGYQIQRTGADAAIASLWYVSDGGTQTLMNAFYTAMQNGHRETEALRLAQIFMVTSNATVLAGERGNTADYEITNLEGQPLSQSGDLAHPYYWAPFILIGNGL